MTVPVLLLFGGTGGGHRSAATAVGDALQERYPGVFAPVLYDPLLTPATSRLFRGVVSWYGPTVRYAPWAWGAVYRASDSRAAASILRGSALRPVRAPVAQAVAALGPALVVSFHPLTTAAAVAAVRRHASSAPVITVVTDLVATHATWRYHAVDQIVAPSPAVAERCQADGYSPDRCLVAGLPVGRAFRAGPLSAPHRRLLRRRLGVEPRRFVAVLTGGAEGSGPLARTAGALTGTFADITVVALCGRNQALARRLHHLSARGPGHLHVRGFVDNMADWYRAADIVVTKAGPQTIAEAACCGTPLLVCSHLPGQERGNTELVVRTGAGLHTPGVADVVGAVGRLRQDRDALGAMRHAAQTSARPHAALQIASLVAGMAAGVQGRQGQYGAA